jgi:hypothetical protein
MVGSLKPVGVTPWTREACRRVVRDAQANGHPVRNVWGYSSSRFSDHRNRRCIDFMVYNRADGDWLAKYLTRYEEVLRVRYVIWWERQWRDYIKRGVGWHRWARYFGHHRHHDHVHVEFDV